MTGAFKTPPDISVPDEKHLSYLKKINLLLAFSSIPGTPNKEISHNFANT